MFKYMLIIKLLKKKPAPAPKVGEKALGPHIQRVVAGPDPDESGCLRTSPASACNVGCSRHLMALLSRTIQSSATDPEERSLLLPLALFTIVVRAIKPRIK